MADSSTSPKSIEHSSPPTQSDSSNAQPNQSDGLPLQQPSSTPPNPSLNPSSNPSPATAPQPSSLVSAPQPLSSSQPYPAAAPSFRPAAPVPVPSVGVPHFSPLPNLNSQAVSYPTAGVPPPGVSSVPPVVMPPVAASGAVPLPYVQPLNPATRSYASPMLNGYPAMPQPIPQGSIPPPVS